MKYRIYLLSLIAILSACSSKPVEVSYELNNYEAVFDYHTECQDSYFADDDFMSYKQYVPLGEVKDYTKSNPIEISWKATSESDITSYTFNYWEGNNKSTLISKEVSDTKISISNLKLGTTYSYQIDAKVGKKKGTSSSVGTFKTDDTGLRNLNISSLSNIRDIGGFKLEGNKRVKQGLLYRSAALNKSYNEVVENVLSEEDRLLMVNELKIKSEIDLRYNQSEKGKDYLETSGITTSPLGNSVTYIDCPMRYQGRNILTYNVNYDSITKFFNEVSNENNYPLVFHCSQGKDRTGGLAFVLELLLGVSYEWAMKDYLFTNFSDVGSVEASGINGGSMIYGVISSYESGETLKDKTYNYLHEVRGIETSTLDKIIANLTENI